MADIVISGKIGRLNKSNFDLSDAQYCVDV